MGLPANLDMPLAFTNEDGSVGSKSFEDLASYWHQAQTDELAKGVDSSEVKKFFDYIPARVFLPWLQALTLKVNEGGRVIFYNGPADQILMTLIKQRFKAYAEASGVSVDDLKVFAVCKGGVIYNSAKDLVRYSTGTGTLDWVAKFYDPAEYEEMKAAFAKALQSAEVVDNCLKLTFADGSTYTSGSLKGEKGETGPQGPQGPPGESGGGSGIPYTEVESLPEASEETKGIIYKVGDSFYASSTVTYGDGHLYSGASFSSGTHVTNNTSNDFPYAKYANVGGELLFSFSLATGGSYSVYWYGGGNYPDEGYFLFEGAESEQQTAFSWYDAPPFETLYPVIYSWGSDAVHIEEVTKMGAEFFGGKILGWKNFITGEEV